MRLRFVSACVVLPLVVLCAPPRSSQVQVHASWIEAGPEPLEELRHPFGSVTPLAPAAGDQEPDVAVNPELNSPRAEPAVAVDWRRPNRVWVGMNDYGRGNPSVVVYNSVDGGHSFDQGTSWPPSRRAPVSGDPSLATDDRGRAYLSFSSYAPPGSAAGSGGLFVARTDDSRNGRWEPRLTRIAADDVSSTSKRCHFHDKGEITATPGGDVVVAWTDVNYDGASVCKGEQGDPAMVARSTDGGRHFRVTQVSAPSEQTIGAMPRVAPDGTIYVAYTRYRFLATCPFLISYGVDIVVARSTDHGRNFDSSVVLPGLCRPYSPNPTLGTYRTYSFPSIEVLPGGDVVLAAIKQAGGHAELMVVRSADRGSSWRVTSTPAMSPAAQYHFPRLAVDRHGILALAYVEQQPGGLYSCMLSTSSNGARAWSAPRTVSSERSFGSNAFFLPSYDGDYIGLALGSDGIAHPAWTDIRVPVPEVGSENVWTRRVRYPL